MAGEEVPNVFRAHLSTLVHDEELGGQDAPKRNANTQKPLPLSDLFSA